MQNSNTNKSTNKFTTMKMVQLAILIAIIIIMDMTGVGIIITPVVAITLLPIPVILGAILLGPASGGILGAVFGVLSIWKATTIGVLPMDIAFSPFKSGSPISSLTMALGARILLGVAAGYLYKLASKFDHKGYVSSIVTTVGACVVHTFTVMACLWLLFPDLQVTIKTVMLTIISFNFLIEVAVTTVFAIAFVKVIPILRKSNKR